MVTQVNDHSFGAPGGVVDLASSCLASTLATADYWLGDKLRPATRQAIRDNVRSRIFKPYARRGARGQAGVVVDGGQDELEPGLHPGRARRGPDADRFPARPGILRAGGPQFTLVFLQRVPGRWLLRGGRRVLEPTGLAPTFARRRSFTRQRMDKSILYTGANTRRMALFMRRFEIVPGVYPAFGDVNPHIQGGPVSLMRLINHRWGMGWTDLDPDALGHVLRAPVGRPACRIRHLRLPVAGAGGGGRVGLAARRTGLEEDKRVFLPG